MKKATRRDYFMDALAKGEECPLKPITREEMYLSEQAKREASGGGGGVSSWNDLTDKPFYAETSEVVLVEQTFAGALNSGTVSLDYFEIVVGETYTVEYDGVSYKLEAWDDNGYPTIGAVWGQYTDYPFNISGNAVQVGIACGDNDEHSLRVIGKQEIVKKLDPKFVPNTTPHVVINFSVTGGSNVTFTSASANMTYNELSKGIARGEICFLTYMVRSNMGVMEVGMSVVAPITNSGYTTVFDPDSIIGFTIRNDSGIFEATETIFVWQPDNTILLASQAFA